MQGGYTNPLRKRLGGDLLDVADSSEQVSLKGALHLLAKLARPARSYPMGAGAVPSGRCGIASSTRRWMSSSSKSATPPIGEGRGCLPGGATGARARRCYTILLFVSQASRSPSAQQSDVGRRTRTFTASVQSGLGTGCLGPERAPKLVRVHYNLRLRRKRSSPEYDDVHLPAMTIDPIEEAADDLIVEDASDSD